jgi:hypothetical protein
MVYGDQSNLVDFKESELLALLEDVKTLKRRYRVLNQAAGTTTATAHDSKSAGVDRAACGLAHTAVAAPRMLRPLGKGRARI